MLTKLSVLDALCIPLCEWEKMLKVFCQSNESLFYSKTVSTKLSTLFRKRWVMFWIGLSLDIPAEEIQMFLLNRTLCDLFGIFSSWLCLDVLIMWSCIWIHIVSIAKNYFSYITCLFLGRILKQLLPCFSHLF